MPRYHFNIYGDVSVPDPEGTVLVNIGHARIEAARKAAAFLEAEGDEMRFGKLWYMEVTNSEGQMLLRLDFKLTAFPLSAFASSGRMIAP